MLRLQYNCVQCQQRLFSYSNDSSLEKPVLIMYGIQDDIKYFGDDEMSLLFFLCKNCGTVNIIEAFRRDKKDELKKGENLRIKISDFINTNGKQFKKNIHEKIEIEERENIRSGIRLHEQIDNMPFLTMSNEKEISFNPYAPAAKTNIILAKSPIL